MLRTFFMKNSKFQNTWCAKKGDRVGFFSNILPVAKYQKIRDPLETF